MEPIQGISLLGLGFLLGLKHALEADHIAAVSTISSQTRSFKTSTLAGAVWGLGHTSILLLAGLITLTFKLTISSKLALSFEFVVGIALVLLGIDLLMKVREEGLHLHAHKHGEETHLHFHQHSDSPSHNHIHKSFLMGTVHGFAGSAALTLFLLASVDSVSEGLIYILVFGCGSIVGMLMVSGVIALPFLLSGRMDKVDKTIKIISGSISIILGIVIMYQIAYVSPLFA
ncbi:MAG: urease accessory protein UreH [Proteobacteria bacterium]|nr:urease accessory protein UreH [Pseudomonadota bacterium]